MCYWPVFLAQPFSGAQSRIIFWGLPWAVSTPHTELPSCMVSFLLYLGPDTQCYASVLPKCPSHPCLALTQLPSYTHSLTSLGPLYPMLVHLTPYPPLYECSCLFGSSLTLFYFSVNKSYISFIIFIPNYLIFFDAYFQWYYFLNFNFQ